ncbi:MAG: SusD/RagB family nutrient-binding outer rane lipoprotein [Bacteroidetes bacterium]|nr:SusD/RagB family nutrient-binding outer rane lipoprotein [Bacteroidota bacterium]
MKKILMILLAVYTLFAAQSCKNYLDVNNNVDSPSSVEPYLRLSPILCGFASNYYDMRMIGSMCQYFSGSGTVPSTYGASMYYAPTSDYAEVWKMVYYEWGANLEAMISDGKSTNKPFYAGIGLALKSYGWYELTSLHGEAPCKEFMEDGRTVFDYDSQEYIINQSIGWAKQAIAYLTQTDATTYPAALSTYDIMYKGDKSKWLKFTYGTLAKIYMTLSSKNTAYLDSAITAVNNSMKSYSDDATVTCTGVTSANSNFFGVLRGNISNTYTQSDYMVDVMTGKVKYYDPNTGSTSSSNGVTQLMAKQYVTDTLTLDPRAICYFGTKSIMPTDLTTINKGTYSFVGTLPGAAPSVTIFGTSTAPTSTTSGTGRWLFRDDAPYIVMTYAELQFIKAEAQYRKGLKSDALTTFKGAVAASMQTTAAYIKQGTAVISGTTQTSVSGDKISASVFNSLATTYLNSQYVNGLALSDFELAHIMMQKYVALYPWGLDTWNDMRRYHYDLKLNSSGIPESGTSWTTSTVYHKLDTDPSRVYKGFYLYSANVSGRKGTFTSTNLGSPSYRLRPRYNSEYVWNQSALSALTPISGLAANYNTSMVWFCIPNN